MNKQHIPTGEYYMQYPIYRRKDGSEYILVEFAASDVKGWIGSTGSSS